MVHLGGTPDNWDPSKTETKPFAAYEPIFWQEAPAEPTASGPNQQLPFLGKTYGRVDLTGRLHPAPIVVDVNGQKYTTYVYGKARMSWNLLPSSLKGKRPQLPLRTPVIVKKADDSPVFFYGGVADCYLF
jgi:hypothetical protein